MSNRLYLTTTGPAAGKSAIVLGLMGETPDKVDPDAADADPGRALDALRHAILDLGDDRPRGRAHPGGLAHLLLEVTVEQRIRHLDAGHVERQEGEERGEEDPEEGQAIQRARS